MLEATERDFIQSIERGFAVLTAFDAEHRNPTLGEVATATGLSRPAVRRILLTLQRLGYVTGDGGRWALTPRVLSIGRHYTESHALIDLAHLTCEPFRSARKNRHHSPRWTDPTSSTSRASRSGGS
ncbi:MAG TPA: helix-turn-helix domain-containing protein [Polyangiaceae bacterium]|nr:helix-turn-helix domain-containing protein [Polyangiaceae bacterium]